MKSDIFSMLQMFQRVDQALKDEVARDDPRALRVYGLRRMRNMIRARLHQLTRRSGMPLPV